ncbi:unnamed protein product [Chrysoparadoxa australica]
MLRSAQMLMAQVLQRHWLGKEWRWQRDPEERLNHDEYKSLALWFADSPRKECIYGIHKMCQAGMKRGKQPGEWYGPRAASMVLGDLCKEHMESLGGLSGKPAIKVLVAQDAAVYISLAEELCRRPFSHQEPTSEAGSLNFGGASDPLLNPGKRGNELLPWAAALLLLVPIRLGLDTINAENLRMLLKLLELPSSVGFLGGRPNRGLYFLGYRGTTVISLDPHITQSSSVIEEDMQLPWEYIQSLHTDRPNYMEAASIDPSLALGFYCKGRGDFMALAEAVRDLGPEAPFRFDVAPPVYNCDDCDEVEGQSSDGSYVLV